MNIQRMKHLAGCVTPISSQEEIMMLNEFAIIPENASLDQVMIMLDAAKRGLGIANRMTNPADKKKHVRAVFINMNKIRGALAKYLQIDNESDTIPSPERSTSDFL